MYRNYSPSFGTNNDPPSTNGNHQSSPDQSDVESLMSSDADDDYFIDDVDAFRSSANAQLSKFRKGLVLLSLILNVFGLYLYFKYA